MSDQYYEFREAAVYVFFTGAYPHSQSALPNILCSIILHYIVFPLVTGWVQSAFYAVWIRAGDPKPRPGSRAFVTHRKRINIAVIVAYLLYTIYEADFQLRLAGDFYQALGVAHGVDERGLQSRFRRLTVMFHPDKISSAQDRQVAEQYYVHLKQCRDVLADPAKRFAYDRFGPEVLGWHKSTAIIPDYLQIGIRHLGMYYAGTGGVLLLLGLSGYLQHATYWRFLALASLGIFELHTITSPTPPTLLTALLNPFLSLTHLRPPYLPFQALSLFRKLILTFFIALSQIGPLLASPSSAAAATTNETEISQQQLQRLGNTAAELQREAGMLMQLEMTPFAGDVQATNELRAKMRRFLVDNTVRSDAEVRSAVGRVVERRRQGVPSGAVGAR